MLAHPLLYCARSTLENRVEKVLSLTDRKGADHILEVVGGKRPDTIDAVYAFEDAHKANEHLYRGAFEKIVIRVGK